MITGGTTHALCCLSACLQYAVKSRRIILPYSESHVYYNTPFYSFYRPNHESPLCQYLVEEDNYKVVRDSYIPPFTGMPAKLSESLIAGPKPDSHGNQRYYLEGVTQVNNNERYLDYPSSQDEGKPYIVTWGRHDRYWKNQIISVLNTLNPSAELKNRISKYLREIEAIINKEKYIGVHFRNTDYQSDINMAIQKTRNLVRKHRINTVFWATDDMSSKEIAQIKLEAEGIKFASHGNIIDHKSLNTKNIHSIDIQDLNKMGSSKIDQLARFYAEVITLSKSNIFVPTSGTVPLLVEGVRLSTGEWNIL